MSGSSAEVQVADRQRLLREDACEYELVVKEPKLRVRPGETFIVETEDALNGLLRSEETLPVAEVFGERWARYEFNPLAGPIYVEGADSGDLLVVQIEDIVVAEQGVAPILAGVGPLHDSAKYPECRGPITAVIKHLPGPSGTTGDGVGVLNDRFSWPLRPNIGTWATAPLRPIASGADSVTGQGPFGGNIDVRDAAPGNKLYLNVYHEGAYLYVGDVHGSQADTEFFGAGDESRAVLTLTVDVVKDRSIPFPRIETPTSVIQLNSYRPLDEAVMDAFRWTMDMLVEEYSFSPLEAYQHLGLNPDVRVNVYQMIKTNRLQYTVGVEFPKRYLEGR